MSQNGQTHFKNLAADDGRILKCVWLTTVNVFNYHCTKKKFSIEYFFSKCDQIRSLMENLQFLCSVFCVR